MPQVPSLAKLIEHYPYPGPEGGAAKVVALIGGTIAEKFNDPKFTAYKNTCAVRVSRCLNYGGDPIERAGGGIPHPDKDFKDLGLRTDKGGDGKWYLYSTYDMRAYLNVRYGHPKKFKGSATKPDLAGVQGIIAFGYFHIDIWNGTTCCGHNQGFNNPKVNEILVWPAP